jgi:hypothetical protein
MVVGAAVLEPRDDVPVASPPVAAPGGKDGWEKFDVVARTVIAAGGLLLAATLPFLVFHVEERSREAQARREIEIVENQQSLAEAQLASALLPRLIAGDEVEKRASLALLTTIAPDLAQQLIAATAAQTPQPSRPDDGPELETLMELADQSETLRDVRRRLDRADRYLRYDLPAQAARELLAAAELASADPDPRVDWTLVEAARGDYRQDRYGAAAEKLRRALAPLTGDA